MSVLYARVGIYPFDGTFAKREMWLMDLSLLAPRFDTLKVSPIVNLGKKRFFGHFILSIFFYLIFVRITMNGGVFCYARTHTHTQQQQTNKLTK